jgi:hypothetical protein
MAPTTNYSHKPMLYWRNTMIESLLLSIDYRLLLGFACLEAIIYFVHRVEHAPIGVLPEPRKECVTDAEMWAWMGRK